MAFAKKTEARAELYVQYVQDEAYAELEKELAKVLPDRTPVDTGALRDGYQFRIENDQLVVSNKEFYALAIQRHGHDFGETVVTEADKIIERADFRARVKQQALARLPTD